MTKQKGILLGVGVAVAILLGLYFHGNLDRTGVPSDVATPVINVDFET